MPEIDIEAFKRDYGKLSVKELMEKYRLPLTQYYYLVGKLGLPLKPKGRRRKIGTRIMVSIQLIVPDPDGRGYKASIRRTITVHSDKIEEIFEDILDTLVKKGWISKLKYFERKSRLKSKEVV